MAQCIVILIPLLHKCPYAGPRKHFEAKLPRAATAGFLSSTKFDMLKYEAHSVTISFALTYHKLQGQTLSKLILDLNKASKGAGALSLRHVYVGMSRVKTTNCLRILPFVSGGNQHANAGPRPHFEARLPHGATAGFVSSTKFDMLKYEAHPITISLALTYHKLQGQTLSKLI